MAKPKKENTAHSDLTGLEDNDLAPLTPDLPQKSHSSNADEENPFMDFKVEPDFQMPVEEKDDASRIMKDPTPIESASFDDIEQLRRALEKKEEEVNDLRGQQKSFFKTSEKSTSEVDKLKAKNRALGEEIEKLRIEAEKMRIQGKTDRERFLEEMGMLKSEYQEKLRLSGNYDARFEELERQKEQWKEKIREELKKIKLKEKELENKYEILKRDSQALLDSKDRHLLELKKKTDAFELEMENLEDRLRKANLVLGSLESKKKRLIETLRLAISLLEQLESTDIK